MANQRIVLGYGHFSAIHPGHIRYLKKARELGDILVVAIKADTNDDAYPFTAEERAATVSNIDCVDQVFIVNSDGEVIVKDLGSAFWNDESVFKFIDNLIGKNEI